MSIINFISRAGGLIINPVSPDRVYRKPAVGAMAGDMRKIAGDFAVVGKDMKLATNKKIKAIGGKSRKS